MSAAVGLDEWQTPIAGSPDSIDAWNRAWRQFLVFTGDPFDTLEPANTTDESFAMGSVFTATYSVLGAAQFEAPSVREAGRRARWRAGDGGRERAHVDALDHLVVGDFTAAAATWDDIAAERRDFAAVRFAHDTYLHIGDAVGRLRSSERAAEQWPFDEPGGTYVAGQYAFALEEVAEYEQAERVGRAALEADPDDLWARHALAHVYESIGDQRAALDLLEGSLDRWSRQDALSTHIWWHLGLRLIAAGEFGRVLDVHDRELASATTPFRLGDLTSLLWRLELAGQDVGDRWDALADRWAERSERHTSAFIDVHTAMAFARRRDHPARSRWLDGVAAAGVGDTSENAAVLRDVARPLVEAIDAFGVGDRSLCCSILDAVGASAERIGGSIAQRDIITLTHRAAGGSP